MKNWSQNPSQTQIFFFDALRAHSTLSSKHLLFALFLFLVTPLLAANTTPTHQSVMTNGQQVVVAGSFQNGLRLEGEKILEAGEGSGCYVAAYDAQGNLTWLKLLSDYPGNTTISLHQHRNGEITVVLSWVNHSRQGDNETELTVLPLETLADNATIKTTSTPVEG